MEEKILEILMIMEKDLKEVKTDIQEVKTDIQEVKTDIKEVKETVNRIENTQNEDVIAILKVNKKRTDFEVDYLNNRMTEMGKRIYTLEKNMQN